MYRKLYWVFLLLLLLVAVPSAQARADRALLLKINGAIGPAAADYFERAMGYADEIGAKLVIVRLDTPGGLDSSMRVILQKITNSSIPVVTYVYPQGARAARAGTFMLYASHVAAMAPATNVGAATPVNLGDEAFFHARVPGATEKKSLEKPVKNGAVSDEYALQQKVIHDAVAYLQSIAELRGRNAEWAEQSIVSGVALTATEALKRHVIDIIAKDVPDLLTQLDGHIVTMRQGTQVIDTKNLIVEKFSPDWRMKFLAAITNPTIAYFLLIAAFYGLFFEFANPGYVLPGVVGGVSLVIALYAFSLLPINYAGIILIILGLAAMIAELFIASFGALGIGGIVAFIIGSIMLIDIHDFSWHIHRWAIFMVTALNTLFIYGLLRMVVKSRFQPPQTGSEAMVGQIGIAESDFSDTGEIHVMSENWRAHANVPIKKGERVRVTKVEGLTVWVEKAE